MDELLQKVKENLILEHNADDKLLERFITAAISYAESYQHIAAGYYQEHPMPPTTEQAVIIAVIPLLRVQGWQHGRLFRR